MSKGPVLFEVEDEALRPEAAEPVPEAVPQGVAMQRAMALASRRGSALGRWLWGLGLSLFGFILALAAWNWVTGLIASHPLLGLIATVLTAGFVLALAIAALRELAGFARLAKVERLQADMAEARDMDGARKAVAALEKLYSGRKELDWGKARLAERQRDVFDAPELLALAERELLAPLDAAAKAEVEASARLVATATALVPLALADVFTALTANLRMIRRIGEIYGGRSGALGAWRLIRAVMMHLLATGAVAMSDDMLHSVAGGGLLSKLSRRFGEGVVNGALTARVGVAAMETCRPMPFIALARPSVSALVGRALAGLFGTGKDDG